MNRMKPALKIVELGDDDIIEEVEAPPPPRTPHVPKKSGKFAAVSARFDTEPPTNTTTKLSEVTPMLANLARLDVTQTPQLRGAVEWNELEDQEAYLVALVSAGFTIEAILDMCPLEDDRTLEVLAALVTARTITLS
jgi:hypothetical protein